MTVHSTDASPIAVFCGSYAGVGTTYLDTARRVGTRLAQQRTPLVYGGGAVGLMGAVADATLAAGGTAIGVMPQALVDSEIGHPGLTELHVVKDMHERKTVMSELAGAFLALPGGSGTLEEIAEQWTWAQLGIHRKPCAFLNVNQFYTPLLELSKRMVTEGFMNPAYDDMLIVEEHLDPILGHFRTYQAPPPKWEQHKAGTV